MMSNANAIIHLFYFHIVFWSVYGHNNTFAPCQLGFYRSNSGLRECTQCPRGRYGASSGIQHRIFLL